MHDIVERLRNVSKVEPHEPLCMEAADEIERLRKALTGLYEACKWEKISPEIDAARKALGEKE